MKSAIPQETGETVVPPLSNWKESLTAAVLACIVISLMGIRSLSLRTQEDALELASYQRLDATLTEKQQTLYRAMLSSVADTVDIRDQEGLWPEASLLEREGIPPFSGSILPSPLNGFLWVGYDGGSWIDYLGTDPSGGEAYSFILRLIDLHAGYHPHPHPGIDYDPERSVAAQIWLYQESNRAYPGERLPEAGWRWVLQENDPVLRKARPVSSTGIAQATE